MKSAIERLKKEVSPPSDPIHVETDWAEAEQHLGFALPADYKQFIATFGSGGFYPQGLFVWNYFHSYPDIDRILMSCEYMEDEDEILLPDFMSHTPICFWGQDGVGAKYFWAMAGHCDKWYVIVTQGRLDYYRFPGLSFSDFLAEFLVERNPQITSLYADVRTGSIAFKPSGA